MSSQKASPKTSPKDLPELTFGSKKAWAAWLEKNHSTSAGVWMKLAKKGSGMKSVSYAEAIEVALCYGWIDGTKQPFNDEWWLQKFTSRSPKSIWSKLNREKAEAFIKSGEMKPAGLAAIEAARTDGRWERAYDSQGKASVPDDFQAALNKNPEAKAFFVTLNSANRYSVLFRVQNAKRAETRAQRIRHFVEMLARHEKLHP